MLVLEWKERAFLEKVNSRCFSWFPATIWVHEDAILVYQFGTKLYKGAWNVSANNWETVGHKNLRLWQIVYVLVFYNISFSWLLPLDGFQFIFLLRDSENDVYVHWDVHYQVKHRLLASNAQSFQENGQSERALLQPSIWNDAYFHSWTYLTFNTTTATSLFLVKIL